MPFKIVRTVERGKPQLCIVPAQWENRGTLKWPKKGAEKLARNHVSFPRPEWSDINCSVKRQGLLSYEAADEELQAMLQNTDTEQEDQQVTIRRPVKRREQVDLNSLAEQLVLPNNWENVSEVETVETPVSQALPSGSEQQTGQTYFIVSDNSRDLARTLPEPNTDIQNILQNQSVLFELVKNIIENQKKIMNEIASLSIQIEESCHESNSKVINLSEASEAEKNSFNLKQIKNVQDLENMELILSDNESKEKLIKSCSIICSRGKGNGINCAYRFLDVLFCREFLCECSWSGGARKDGVKVSLKCYKKTLNFFFKIINQWDNEYTQEANESFFKNVLKNANKRKNVKFERIPTKRRRTTQNKLEDVQAITEINKQIDKENVYMDQSEEEESLC